MHLSAAETIKVHRLITCLFLFLFLFLGTTTADYFSHRCRNTTNYNTGSPYQANLKELLLSLQTTAPLTGFLNATTGETPNRVYGRALCRGDISAADCGSCLTSASSQILQHCPNRKGAVIWFDECQLAYYGNPFVFNTSTVIKAGGYNDENITEPVLFKQSLGGFMSNLVSEAAIGSTKFAAGEVNFTGGTILYGLAQCCRDLSRVECNDCLGNAMADATKCCSFARGVRYLYDSCTVRYEVYPFFGAVTAPPLQPASPTVIYKRRNPTAIIIIVIAIAIVVVVLSNIGTYLVTKKREQRLQAMSIIKNKESQIFDSSAMKP